ncbi:MULTISPECIES: response regulator transcription factor [Bacillus]|uniref:response regulator transcription factor n=1 Tax=Bacillus TaxID=1386 RepID=UPI00006B6BCD|nr:MULTISPECIES: response regulator transcription factor [Bacillus]OXT17133.1 DNA-binding response regulator [Bacillus sp. OG2]EAR66644.1 DNA-binding response regulator [Bacillus sp. NRRL B-14911]MCK6205803.1 response regulator transcription factor [Bacillus infantis]MCP1157388.1 response regulator transcription factor [Bacillus infantis]MDT0163045.1 response regulator transcription factor [Bacillus sp. AG4(2022)]
MIEGKILVVEDELPIRKLILFNLERSNFEVLEAGDGKTALQLAEDKNPSLVVLDVMLPDMDGFEICARLRERHPDLPIIILSARGQDMDKIMGLEIGADDYIVKPFNPLELAARIRSVLRRTSRNTSPVRPAALELGPYLLEVKTQRLYKSGRLVKLTAREFQLMKFFLQKRNEPVTRDELLDEVWGLNYFGDPKTVDVHIRRLREKIEDEPSSPLFLKTVWGYGYCFQESGHKS